MTDKLCQHSGFRLLPLMLLIGVIATGQEAPRRKLTFAPLDDTLLERNVSQAPHENSARLQRLHTLFETVDCSGTRLAELPVKGSKLPNLSCTLPGEESKIIYIGAHFDKTPDGDGVVDNWSGASMLPALYYGLRHTPRRHVFVFLAFTDEELGLIGSTYFVKHLSKESIPNISAMVNLDTLGLGPMALWQSRADKTLGDDLICLMQAMDLPITPVNVEKVGSSDSESFRRRGIPAITIHSVTQATIAVLHSSADNLTALHMSDYKTTYRGVLAYLAYLDDLLP